MHAQDMPQDEGESKRLASPTHKFWFAVYQDVFDHEIVGMHVQPPTAADPARKAAFPFMIWIWMCGEAAHRERDVVIKGQYINIVRGQLVMAERFLAKKANWSRKAAAVFLARLERHGMVRLSTVSRHGQLLMDFGSSKRGPLRGPTITIVTLCNYEAYQFGLRKQGAASGAARGPTRGRIPTSNNLTIDKSHQSPLEIGTKKDQSSDFGTDETDRANNVVPLRKPTTVDAPEAEFVIPDKTRQKIEAIGIDPEELVDRMHEQVDKGRRIGSKSRYLITSALNAAHERDGTPIEVLKAIMTGNKFARTDAIVKAAVGKQEPTTDAVKQLRARMSAPRTAGAALLKTLKK